MKNGGKHQLEWYYPDEGGRNQTYNRDFEMVQAADLVEAYFDETAIMVGGTAHVVEAALSRSIPVIAYAVSPNGDAVWPIAESEYEHTTLA